MEFQTVLSAARDAALELKETWDKRIEVILRYCTQSPGWAAFPGLNLWLLPS